MDDFGAHSVGGFKPLFNVFGVKKHYYVFIYSPNKTFVDTPG